MNIHQCLVRQLEQLVAHGPQKIDAVLQADGAGLIVGIPPEDFGCGASINLADHDRYSGMLQHLEVYNNKLSLSSGDKEGYLRQSATAIIRQLDYLEEPLELIELDTIENMALLRSSPPRRETNQTTYWEIWVWATPHPHARIERYQWAVGSEGRDSVNYPVTFALLGRIAQSLAASLAGE